ncbi:hypothetical protein ABI59_01740 [Acidobacteria bacterium Mor1]|nr:hypothetical protein ABI59_01740 [Acidobacteria bacterium Mor1]
MSGTVLQLDALLRLVDGFDGRRLAVLGDFVVDEFVQGDIARVSREAPVLILDYRGTTVVPGGGGNTVANLRALGADPRPVGVVGRDASGDRLIAALAELGVSTSSILRERSYVTPAKSRILAGGIHTRRQQIVRLDRGEPGRSFSPALQQRIVRKLEKVAARADGLVVADYGYGSATPEIVGALGKHGLQLTVDSRGRILDYPGGAACTPNQEEVEIAVGSGPLHDDESVRRAGARMLRRSGHGAVLMTRGAKGMCLFEPRKKPLTIPAFGSDEVADVTGAGDTVTAVFSLARAAGGSFSEAAALANIAAGLVVMKAGTATISAGEIRQALLEEQP